MDYEKKYKEALERARDYKNNIVHRELTVGESIMDYVFPELRENEDEQIRKEIIDVIQHTFSETSRGKKKWLSWLEKQGEPNPYSGTSFEYNGHTWGMCARDYGVDILCDKHIIGHLDNQGESYTKRDVDDAWLKGMCDAKRELEKQGDSPIKWNKNTKDCKPKVSHSVLMKTTHGIAEGEWQGEYWHQYRWAALVRDTDVLSWMELSDLEKQGEQKPIDYNEELKKCRENPLYFFDKYVRLEEQKSAWSEEDEKEYKYVLKFVDNILNNCGNKKDYEHCKRCYDWLKSLKPQNTWKPSDEQIKVCKEVYADILSAKGFDLGTVIGELNRLEEQLKKLRKE